MNGVICGRGDELVSVGVSLRADEVLYRAQRTQFEPISKLLIKARDIVTRCCGAAATWWCAVWLELCVVRDRRNAEPGLEGPFRTACARFYVIISL